MAETPPQLVSKRTPGHVDAAGGATQMGSGDEDLTTYRVIKARFTGADPKVLARVRELSILLPDELPTDPKVIADDLQSVASLALGAHENVEMLIALIDQISKVGTIKVTPL